MTRWSGVAALMIGLSVLVVGETAGASTSGEPAAAAEVILTEVGDGWSIVGDEVGMLDSVTRTFAGASGTLSIQAFAVTDPPGVRTLFSALAGAAVGIELIDEPQFELAAWGVAPAGRPGDGGVSQLFVGSRSHFFSIRLVLDAGATLDGPAFVLDVARRQVAAAGETTPGATSGTTSGIGPGSDADAELVAWLPAAPPSGFGLEGDGLTLTGPSTDDVELFTDVAITDFLARRSHVAVRVWGSPSLRAAVGLSRYPYDVFAASALHRAVNADGVTSLGQLDDMADATVYRLDPSRVGVAFRRGDVLATVLVDDHGVETQQRALRLAIELAVDVEARLPAGDSSAYDPTPPSRFVGLGITAALVLAATAGSRAIAWMRARRVRRRWAVSADDSDQPATLRPEPQAVNRTIDLDDDAATLRRRGRALAGFQVLTVVIGVVALAGDFATAGMVVAAISMLTGLAVSHWWVRRESSLLGPAVPSTHFALPRLPGALLGIVTFAVLGIGVSFFLKGVRYLVLPVTLAQLHWSDLLGIAPRVVGTTFAIGGALTAMLGAALYRLARALARGNARAVLLADPRPPALYLRSFGDDALPLPTIASARRPLFELLSIRGADPFEEAVAWELNAYAPVVAVGRPGARLHTLGAAREHLGDDVWQAEVAERMAAAAVIVLAPGETPGLAWELMQIAGGGHLPKTVLLFPPLAPDELGRRWHSTAETFRHAGAAVDRLTSPVDRIHTVRVDEHGELSVTLAATRDEATYRTAIDRALEGMRTA